MVVIYNYEDDPVERRTGGVRLHVPALRVRLGDTPIDARAAKEMSEVRELRVEQEAKVPMEEDGVKERGKDVEP